MSFVKLAARCLMISAMPFLLSALFFRSRLRRHTVPEHAHLAESAEVVPAELYYLGTSYTAGSASEYHQHNDVIHAMTDVTLADPAEIGDGGSEIHKFSQNTALESGFVL